MVLILCPAPACLPVCLSCLPAASPAAPGSSSIFRTATSRYTTAEQSTLEDLKCQICLNSLRQCVALEPCGHNFCATCLSHHLGSQLQSSQLRGGRSGDSGKCCARQGAPPRL